VNQPLRRLCSIMTAGVIAAALTPAPAAADTVVSEWGVTGAHSLVDSHALPGAFCLYDAIDGGLRKVRARHPAVYAAAGVGSEAVTARAQLQKGVTGPGGTTWTNIASGPVLEGTATGTVSPFSAWAELTVPGTGRWRVVWEMTWYGSGRTQAATGTATNSVDTYGRHIGRTLAITQSISSCADSIAGTQAKQVKHGNRSVRTVALTFDMGFASGGSLIHWLVQNHVQATIFTTGQDPTSTDFGRALLAYIGAHRDILDIGNHSWNHPNLANLTTIPEVIAQVTRAEDVVRGLAGGTTKPFFRPPFGIAHERERNAIGAAGFTLDMMWDVITDDYQPISVGGPTTDELVLQVLSQVRPGSIVIMHVNGPNTLDALPAIIAGLHDRNLEPVQLRELLDLDI
jgi:peptidoglycan/xylan/chitin deacetylase (PgdA/CDA1 family)